MKRVFPSRKIMAHSQTRRSGLTLIELIIAISLSAVVMGACAVCVSTAVKVWGYVRSKDSSEITQARMISALQRDIASATLLNETLFDGDSSKMSFSRLSQISFAEHGVITIPCKVEWFRNASGNLIRKETAITNIPSLEHESETDFGKCPVFLLSYAGIPLGTQTQSLDTLNDLPRKPTYEWQSDWPRYRYYPAAVKVQLEDYQFLARVMVYSSPDSQAPEKGVVENE